MDNQLFPQQSEIENLTPSESKKKFGLTVGSVGVFILISLFAAYYFLSLKRDSLEIIAQAGPQKNQQPTVGEAAPTPWPFADMTIPFLRQKTYESTLAQLTPAYNGSNYSAYITSYRSDGLTINGLLTKPAGEMPKGGWPAIVFVHGYIPPASYETNGEAYASYVDYLASNGFVVFKIDLRGHGQSEGEPGGAYYSSDYISDVLHAYSALENASFVKKQAIGLWGHSMAGNVTMRSWAVKKQIPAIVIWAGAVYTYEDMLEYRITDSSYQPPSNTTQRSRRRQEIYEKYGSPSASVRFWQEVAPVTYLNELKGALQLHHAVDDDVVNVGYSRNLNAILEKSNVAHEYYEYTSGGHNISGTSFSQAMQKTVEFYKTHLK